LVVNWLRAEIIEFTYTVYCYVSFGGIIGRNTSNSDIRFESIYWTWHCKEAHVCFQSQIIRVCIKCLWYLSRQSQRFFSL